MLERAVAMLKEARLEDGLYRHSVGVANLACLIAEELGWPALRVAQVTAAGLLHDQGLAATPGLAGKRGVLSAEEFQTLRQHPVRQALLLTGYGAEVVAAVLYHHEQWNGGGYFGLEGEKIPLMARVLALADAVEAMGAPRPYRPSLDLREILLEVRRQCGRQFDPLLVAVLVEPHPMGKLNLIGCIDRQRGRLARLMHCYGDLQHPLVYAQSLLLDRLITDCMRLAGADHAGGEFEDIAGAQ